MWWSAAAYPAAVFLANPPIAAIRQGLYLQMGRKSAEHGRRLGEFVGYIERTLFVAALQSNRAEFIGFWLALKVAGKWSGWEKGIKENGVEIPGRQVFNVFLIGSGLSIGYSVVAARLAQWGASCDWLPFGLTAGATILGTVLLYGVTVNNQPPVFSGWTQMAERLGLVRDRRNPEKSDQ